jgi:tetratricopeptide (TPR) repeat protein
MAKAKSSRPRKKKPARIPTQLKLILGLSAVHIICWFVYLGEIPIGQYPTPEEKQTIETAFALAQGQAGENLSFTLYEFGLSFVARFVEGEAGLTLAARWINAIALLLTTLLCAKAAGRYWKKPGPVWIAGFLTGLNPVLAFWAAGVAPTLLCVLGASYCYAQLLQWLRSPAPNQSLMIGLGLALSLAFDSSLVLLAAGWPIAALLYPTRRRLAHFLSALSVPALAFLVLALSNLQLQDPFAWTLSNLLPGTYEILNSHEAYDGKSYSLQKSLNFYLLVNPIHGGLLVIAALTGCWIRVKNGHQGNSLIALLILFVAFAVGYSMTDAGSQTRAILYPIFAIYAAGVYFMPRIWRHARVQTKRMVMLGLLLAAGLTYSDFHGARAPENWEQDYALLAEANLALEHNESASEWATQALEINPDRQDMQSVLVRSAFNDWALSPNPTPLTVEATRLFLEATQEARFGSPVLRTIEAIYLFKLREQEKAVQIWTENKTESALAWLCLYWTGNEPRPGQSEIAPLQGDPYFDLLAASIEINRNSLTYSEGEQLIDNMLANAH